MRYIPAIPLMRIALRRKNLFNIINNKQMYCDNY